MREQVFRQMSAMASRALAYFQKRELCWHATHVAARFVAPSHAGAVAADGEDVVMSDAVPSGSHHDHPTDANPHLGGSGEPAAAAAAVSSMGVLTGDGSSSSSSASLPGAVLEDMLLWLTSYRDVFTRPCCMTGKLLAMDPSQHPMPPLFRQFK